LKAQNAKTEYYLDSYISVTLRLAP